MTLPSDRELAQLQLAAYQYPDASGTVTAFAWDWQAILKTRPAGFKIVNGVVVIILPGTQDKEQWEDDFNALPRATNHPVFGRIHAGFWSGIEAFCDALVPALPPGMPIVVIGHSLGGAEAPLVAAQLMAMGFEIARLVCFAPPRPGMQELATYLAAVPKALYRTVGSAAPGRDLVCEVPFYVPAVAPYCHVGTLTDLWVTPFPDDPWLVFKYHHCQLYAGALAATP